MSTVPKPPIIRVSFDIEQINSYATWSVVDKEDRRNPYSPHGRHAGALHFVKGEKVDVEVVAFGHRDLFKDMCVKDAMIYAVPHTDGETRSGPSPFSFTRATTPIEDWKAPVEHGDRNGKRKELSQTCCTPLCVVQGDGRWRFSLILTVAITRKGVSGDVIELRVFTFDPEIQVGSGTEPPRGSSGEPGVTRSG